MYHHKLETCSSVTNESSAKQREVDQVLGLLALWASPTATEATWEGQCDLSCPESCVTSRVGEWPYWPGATEEQLELFQSMTVYLLCCENQKYDLYLIYQVVQPKLPSRQTWSAKSAQATTTQQWMDSRLPLNTCYWWVTQNQGKISCNSWHPSEAATGNKTCIANLNSVDLLCLCSHSSATPVMLYSSSKEACDLICYPIELRFLSPLLIPQCCSVKITQKNVSYRRFGDWG